MLKRFFRIGVHSQLSSYLRIKVILSNQIAIIITFVMIFYLFFSFIYFPEIKYIYIAGIITMMIGVFLNYVGIYGISRFIISITPTWFSLSTYLTLSAVPNTGYTEIIMVGICMLVAPFVLFDAREAFLRNVSFLFCAVPLLFYRNLDELIYVKVNGSLIETDTFAFVNRILSLLSMFGYLAVLQSTTKKTEDKNKELLLNMELKASEIEDKTKFLENTLIEVQQAREDEEKRNWVSNGISQINEIMRAEIKNEKLYDALLSHIVKYLKANQGALYILNGEDGRYEKYLKLVSCYAFDKKKFIEKEIRIGQGLVGQCYLEKKKILLNKVPDNYISITSGLGEANPRVIVIVPMMVNEEIHGIIEIASFKPLENHEIEFIEKNAENIAAVLKNNQINHSTLYLLEESRQQAEEMKAQEEEMRQNMEELQATQEEIERKERDYLRKINFLEQEIEMLKSKPIN